MSTKEKDATTDVTDAADPAGGGDGPAVQRVVGRQGRGPLLPVVTLVLAVALVVLVVVNVLHVRGESPRDEAPKEVAAHVVKLLSYTPTTVSSDLASEQKWLTGDFREEYSKLVTGTVAPAATKGGVTAEAEVTARGVESSTRDRVVLLLFVNITSTRASAKEAEVQGSRVRVVAQRVDGTWKISDLSPA
ncbi:hypothetical protein ASD11_00835 [Aeromicrobium sp. Root495]|uniref:hypothetical protein n=1 Tax=Aeromicrobium sp. Root495 TaxID=1736550 RepID=UPI0006F9EC9E|nr:hypothetical protein [Aeromicrobium sp. Root495]KQY58249.1 hypothetical protein ASD11_00835 [Aeromicrobium sp. Root495]